MVVKHLNSTGGVHKLIDANDLTIWLFEGVHNVKMKLFPNHVSQGDLRNMMHAYTIFFYFNVYFYIKA